MIIRLFRNGKPIHLGYIIVHGNSSVELIEQKIKEYNNVQTDVNKVADGWHFHSPEIARLKKTIDLQDFEIDSEYIKLS